jgi:hypothetical protein
MTPSAATTRGEKLLGGMKLIITPGFGTVWLGPFDQLVSAGHALLKAEALGYANRNLSMYYFDVHAKVVPLILEENGNKESSSPQARDNFLSSFYFNAGIQRLTFAAERLLISFVSISCACGRNPEISRDNYGRWPKLKYCLQKAEERLKHIVADDSYSESLNALGSFMNALQGWNYRDFVAEKHLSMLRDHVNVRKHSVYIRSEALNYGPRGPNGRPQWSPTDQADVASDAFLSTAVAYSEVVAWRPDATI